MKNHPVQIDLQLQSTKSLDTPLYGINIISVTNFP